MVICLSLKMYTSYLILLFIKLLEIETFSIYLIPPHQVIRGGVEQSQLLIPSLGYILFN